MKSKYVYTLFVLVFMLVVAPNPFFIIPRSEEVGVRQELEQRILASTVRLEWQVRQFEADEEIHSTITSFATVKGGRYLVTHNHLDIPLSGLDNGQLIYVSIYTADGKIVWLHMPRKAFTIEEEYSETLILDFGSYGDEGLFDFMGVPSAKFKAWELLSLKPGMKVAQIDWDKATGHVEWVVIKDVITKNGIPRLILDNHVVSGASGGGVFWNGYHVANTWSQVMVYDENRETVVDQFSVVALNSYASNLAGNSMAIVSKLRD